MTDLRSSDGTRLALHDFGGAGEPVLLLPGLCGYAGEWAATIAFLRSNFHVYALDPRGHGDSETRPADVSREAHVADTTAALHTIGPAVVIGQSMGGHTGFLTAAGHPELVTRLIVAESSPQGVGEDSVKSVDGWLAGWPVPFPDLAAAAEFLGGGLVGQAWAGGLDQRGDGWHPRFERDVMVATLAAMVEPRWAEFAAVTCPTLVVKGGNSEMATAEYERMRKHPIVSAVEIPGAGHDVHLDSPDPWRSTVTKFVTSTLHS
ncbi:alpha/beta hydrolase [Rhizocola hellebori]|uniref:Alpha/beta hydrolase n=1 Tax=Rhizocola hellebori TaxID=1392758 RepID=A0A8J3QDH4_9ACTN|nr:alpha/beta hydrolase [Rhizocola hellebori]GIH08686.1 alpha/beta hydrolase [Rhizocola hellebori]